MSAVRPISALGCVRTQTVNQIQYCSRRTVEYSRPLLHDASARHVTQLCISTEPPDTFRIGNQHQATAHQTVRILPAGVMLALQW